MPVKTKAPAKRELTRLEMKQKVANNLQTKRKSKLKANQLLTKRKKQRKKERSLALDLAA